jgi:pyruvate dehydrogenase E2 component (dihydrolipoamide acetyltransferase)
VAAATVAAPVASSGEALRISPKARRLAKEHGVDLSRVKGSGPGGEILADDVLRAAQSPVGAGATAGVGPASVTGPSTETPTTVGRLMAERTTQSWTTVPHFFVTRDVDASGLKMARDAMLPAVEQSHGVKATLTDLIVLVVARTLKRHPRLNASWNGGSIVVHPDVNVGLAVAVENAVVTGVIPNTDTTPIGEIATRRRDLLQRATVGRLRPEDVSGATFTISNLGMYDVDAFTAIIVPPQAAILAVGAIADRVVAVDGTPAVRPMLTVTLSCDHRVVDGVRAAEFLGDLATALRKPDVL